MNAKKQRVCVGMSGGVDSCTVAALVHRAVGDQLTCILVDHGLLRDREAEEVVEASLQGMEKGKLFVIPGWRYKLLVSVIRMLPRGVLHFALTRGPASLRRERQKR